MAEVKEENEKMLVADSIIDPPVERDFVGISEYSVNERSLLKKIQTRIFPWIFLMYFLCYIDRSNISNAIVMNSEKGHSLSQTTLNSQQVSIGLGLFYVGYVIFEIPSNLIMTRVPPSAWFARIMVSWGITLGLFAAISADWNYYILRFLLGCFEAGFFPGVAYYMTLWFRKRETSSGFSYWYIALPFSNMISSLLSTGISYMDGIAGLYGWRWNFILFSVPTVLVGIATWFYLPDSPERHLGKDDTPARQVYKLKFLDQYERELSKSRLQEESIGSGETKYHGHTLKEMLKAMLDWKAVTLAFVYLPGLVGSTSLAYYVPSYVKTFGLSSVNSQLLAAPLWFYAAIHMLVMAHISDRIGKRSIILLANMTLALVAFVVMAIAGQYSFWAAYVATAFALGGSKSVTTICIPWGTNSFEGEKGAAAIALVSTIANIGNVVASFTLYGGWAGDDKRKYLGSNLVAGGLMIISIVAVIILRIGLTRINKEIDRNGISKSGRTKHYIL